MFAIQAFEFIKETLKTIPSNYLEIGVYSGESIHQLALEFPDKTIIGVDPFIEDGYTTHNSKVQEGDPLIAQEQNTMGLISGLPNIKFFKQTSIEFNNNLSNEQALELDVGIIFIDGSHHYVDVKNDYNLAIKLLGKKYGYVCFDDITLDDVSTAINEFTTLMKDRIISVNEISTDAVKVFEIKAV
jgi:hypothetical protein